MSKCPSCGAQLRFDIPSQRLICDYCGANLDPYEYDRNTKNKDAKKVDDEMAGYMNDSAGKKQQADDTFVVTVYTCPNCGGEIISTSNAATEVCTYCGAQVMMQQKEGTSVSPDLIIPFSKDREELRKICAEKMHKAFFAPKEFRDPKAIDSFRGIYMPFWVYDIKKKGHADIRGKREYREGDYDCTDHYDISLDTDASYEGIPFDSASSFEDDISDAIAPYPAESAKKFTPSFISGFYADKSDVPADIYKPDAVEAAQSDTYDALDQDKHMGEVSVDRDSAIYSPEDASARSAFFPVWFMTLRRKDRVAYAVINGETGKMAIDMPIDLTRYVLVSALAAAVIFVISYFFIETTSKDAIFTTAFLAMIGVLVSSWEKCKVSRKDLHTDDRGYEAVTEPRPQEMQSDAPTPRTKDGEKAAAKAYDETTKNAAKAGEEKNQSLRFKTTASYARYAKHILFAIGAFVLWMFLQEYSLPIIDIAVLIIALVWLKPCKKHLGFISILSLLIPLMSAAVAIYNPFYDSIYYAVTFAQVAMLFLQMADTIKWYNILSTRKLPQFRREGGDNRA